MKQASDQPGTVKAAVLLSSDVVLANPMLELAKPEMMDQVYQALGIGRDYFVSNLFLIQIAKTNAGLFGYSFSLKFARGTYPIRWWPRFKAGLYRPMPQPTDKC